MILIKYAPVTCTPKRKRKKKAKKGLKTSKLTTHNPILTSQTFYSKKLGPICSTKEQ